MLEPILFVPDTHVPYHDKRAWRLMLAVARTLKPKHILVLGDFIDCYAVSSHSKSPDRARHLIAEVNCAKKCLAELRACAAPSARCVFIAGNHEDRLGRYIADKAPELFGLVDIPSILDLQPSWLYVPYKDTYRLGRLYATHDVGYAGRYGAQRLLDTFQHSVVGGHTHRLSYIVEANVVGEAHVAATFGWLGDFEKIDYMHRGKARKEWAHGFGIGWLDTQTGAVHIVPVPIVKGKVVVQGVRYPQ